MIKWICSFRNGGKNQTKVFTQSFVISKSTTFDEILKAACEYWNEDYKEYSLFNE